MEKIDFSELGQSFAVNCEKPKTGEERRNLTHLSCAFPKCAHTGLGLLEQGKAG